MEEEGRHFRAPSASVSSSVHGVAPSLSTSSSSSGIEEEEEEENVRQENEDRFSVNNSSEEQQQHHHHHHHHQQQQQSNSGVSYRVNISIISNIARASDTRDDVWSCVVVLLTFWVFASMIMILGYYGSVKLELGPNCSRLLQTNPIFVQSTKVEGMDELKSGPVLYGFFKPPPLDVEISWNESHNSFVPVNFHKEWVYYLNKGSKLDISYTVKSQSSLPLSLVIAKGRESLVQWIEDPSYPNTTLSWNIIDGSGKIQQEISMPANYYIAVGNLNSEEVQIELKFAVKALAYETSNAYHRCSLGNNICSLKLFLLGTNVAVLTSPGPQEGPIDGNWSVKLSYGPRWITYFVGSGLMTALILFVCRICNKFQATREQGTGFQATATGSDQAPLLSHKDDDLSSWDSSRESTSHDEEDLDRLVAVNCGDGHSSKEGESHSNPQRLCVICFEAPRDCFFLPCGHCAACFTCGTRIAEEAGTCPVCRRKMKKVRKIFKV